MAKVLHCNLLITYTLLLVDNYISKILIVQSLFPVDNHISTILIIQCSRQENKRLTILNSETTFYISPHFPQNKYFLCVSWHLLQNLPLNPLLCSNRHPMGPVNRFIVCKYLSFSKLIDSGPIREVWNYLKSYIVIS